MRRLSALALLPLSISASAGTHVGNIVLRTADDSAPMVWMDPDHTPRLALRTCGESTPHLIDAEYDSGGQPFFPLDSSYGTICQVGLSLGAPLDLVVGTFHAATVSPAPIGLTISPTSVDTLVGSTIRAGTPSMMTLVRTIAAVPRTATSSEAATLEAALSVLTLDSP